MDDTGFGFAEVTDRRAKWDQAARFLTNAGRRHHRTASPSASSAAGSARSAHAPYIRPEGWSPSGAMSEESRAALREQPVTSTQRAPASRAASAFTRLNASSSDAIARGVTAREPDRLIQQRREPQCVRLDDQLAVLIVDADQQRDERVRPAGRRLTNSIGELVRGPAGARDDLGLRDRDAVRADPCREQHRPALGFRDALADRVRVAEGKKAGGARAGHGGGR